MYGKSGKINSKNELFLPPKGGFFIYKSSNYLKVKYLL
nr:MAG TPA: hypothetical protein [Caudoviricetes sp.]